MATISLPEGGTAEIRKIVQDRAIVGKRDPRRPYRNNFFRLETLGYFLDALEQRTWRKTPVYSKMPHYSEAE